MDKFKLTILKKMIHNKEQLSNSQIEEFAKYFLEIWAKNNYNSTPSKLSMKFYKSLPSETAEYSSTVLRLIHYMRYCG